MPPHSPILLPVAVLVLWTLVMLGWLVVVRGRAVSSRRINIMASRGGRGQDLEGVIDKRDAWPAHNYTHLHEQPTVFYAIAIVAALIGAGGGWGAILAWIYVVARIAHSIWQASVNLVSVRFALYAVSTTALAVLIVRTLILLL